MMRVALPLLTLLVVGCSSPRSTTAQSSWPSGFEARPEAAPVLDEGGVAYAIPFTGGFYAPLPQLADLAGDATPDLAVAVGGAAIEVYEAGPDGFRLADPRLGGITPGPWFRFVDADGDGDLDLFTRGAPAQVRYYERTASGLELRADPLRAVDGVPVLVEDSSVPSWGDLDGDGDPDLLAGKADLGTVTHYRHDGVADGVPQYAFTTDTYEDLQIFEGSPTCTGTALHGANATALADLQGGAALDFFWGDFFSERLYFFLNTGTVTDPAFELTSDAYPSGPGTPGGQNAPTFADRDGDGDLDLVVGVLGGLCQTEDTPTDNLVAFENTGTPTAPAFRRESTRVIRSVDVGRRSVPAFADLDGDGDLDLVVGDGNSDSDLTLFLNDGTATAPAFRLADEDWLALEYDFGGYAPAFGDLDADGDLDLLVGALNGRLALLRNTGSATDPQYALEDLRAFGVDSGQYSRPSLGDLDGDGDLDLISGDANGRVALYRNTGTASEPAFETESNGTPTAADVAWLEGLGLPRDIGEESAPDLADVDADGDLDVLIGERTGTVRLFENTGGPSSPAFVEREPLAPRRRTAAPRAVDLFGGGPVIVAGSDAGGLLLWAPTGSSAGEPSPSGEVGLRLEAYPNPSSGRISLRLSEPAAGRYVVQDAIGRTIAQLAGPEWDGTQSGLPVAGGRYWVRFEGEGGESATASVTLLR